MVGVIVGGDAEEVHVGQALFFGVQDDGGEQGVADLEFAVLIGGGGVGVDAGVV